MEIRVGEVKVKDRVWSRNLLIIDFNSIQTRKPPEASHNMQNILTVQ
jgi:hypothetical protein